MRFASGDIVHLRPSINALECRVYTEVGSAARSEILVRDHLARLGATLAR